MSANHSQSESDLIPIGKVGRPHGLRGAFFVSDREAPLERGYRRVYLGASATSVVPASVVSVSMQGGRPVLQCSLAQDRDQAQKLLHQIVFVERHVLQTVWSGQGLLWADVQHALVMDPESQVLGRVMQLYNAGASDVALVERDDGAQLDLPLIKDYVDLAPVLPVDPSLGRILRLRVSCEIFADLWSERVSRVDQVKGSGRRQDGTTP